MNHEKFLQPIDPFNTTILREKPREIKYSIVGHQIPESEIDMWKKGDSFLIEKCPVCEIYMIIHHAELWRESGSAIICDHCCHRPVGTFVINDSYEPLKTSKNGLPLLPAYLMEADSDLNENKASNYYNELESALEASKFRPDSPWPHVYRAIYYYKSYYNSHSDNNVNLWVNELKLASKKDPNNALVEAWNGFLSSIPGQKKNSDSTSPKGNQIRSQI
ncbi:MAG: hypothetical protein NXI29_14735 [bacterium]|nr:hypothetical protein [bacterium]